MQLKETYTYHSECCIMDWLTTRSGIELLSMS